MEEVRNNRPDELTGQPPAAQGDSAEADRSRRDFLRGSARKLAYAAPLILLFHPKQACASGGSQLTTA